MIPHDLLYHAEDIDDIYRLAKEAFDSFTGLWIDVPVPTREPYALDAVRVSALLRDPYKRPYLPVPASIQYQLNWDAKRRSESRAPIDLSVQHTPAIALGYSPALGVKSERLQSTTDSAILYTVGALIRFDFLRPKKIY
jgi:hypothetical protein